MIKVIDSKNPIYVNNIYCINLEKDSDRKERIKKMFKKYNINVEFINGVYNKEKPHIGCRESHFNILCDMYNKKYENIMILEDDCEFLEFPFKISKDIPENWDIIYPGWLDIDFKSYKYDDNIIKAKSCRSTHCYIINKKSIPYILRMIRCNEHIDMFYLEVIQQAMNCYGLYPLKAIQTINTSNMTNNSNKTMIELMINNSHLIYKNNNKNETNVWKNHYLNFHKIFNNNYEMTIEDMRNINF